jgi:hypothetical protein
LTKGYWLDEFIHNDTDKLGLVISSVQIDAFDIFCQILNSLKIGQMRCLTNAFGQITLWLFKFQIDAKCHSDWWIWPKLSQYIFVKQE